MVTKELSMLDYAWVRQFEPDKSLLKGQIYLAVKRLIDILIVLMFTPFWLPMVGLITLLIRLQEPKASPFFIQIRTGKSGKRFRMYKFRTMVPNAEELKQKYMHLNELTWPDFKISNDPRVTRIGRFLRKTSLDELPQLINVLKGEMSLVGPRPTSFSAKTYHLWHTERLDAPPGLTGLWQIVGRDETLFDDRVRMDIAYIEHRCLTLDVIILWKTVESVLVKHNAH